MKNKLRTIIVNDKEYKWSVSNYNCDGDGGSILKIWFNKILIYENLIYKSIKPSDIANLIKKII